MMPTKLLHFALLCLSLQPFSLGQSLTWTKESPLLGRFSPGMTYNSWDGSIVMFGGASFSVYMNDTWVWSGNRWNQRDTFSMPRPSGRNLAGMAHHTASKYTILFGGRCGPTCFLDDTWGWNGANWELFIPRGTPGNPVARFSHGMVDETPRGRILMFGGDTGTQFLADTWIYEHERWEPLVPAHSPSPRAAFHMAYDPKRNRVLLFGGWDGNNFLGDTWEWTGSNWVRRFPSTKPSARALYALSFTQRGRIALFGGLGRDGLLNDFWEWDGSNWQVLETATTPSVRSEHKMAFDSQRKKMVMFGGWKGISTLVPDDTWELLLEEPSVATSFGHGCAGSQGRPSLDPSAGNLPWTGDTFATKIENLPLSQNQTAFGVLGFSNRRWGSQELPLALDTLGMPGCTLLISVSRVIPLSKRSGNATWEIDIPAQQGLIGFPFYLQILATDFGANGLGLTTSNALMLVPGAR